MNATISSAAWSKRLAQLLRLGAAVEMLAFPWVVIPRVWMERSHAWLGMGDMPAGAVVDFTIRQSAFFYGMHGLLLWWLAGDVLRYRPLVRLIGFTYLLCGPVFLLIDWNSGTPLWWTAGDPAVTFGFGLLILVCDRSIPQQAAQSS